jgi:uncharacterized SAM-binding protein YcdF (DUF218 family)
MIKKLFALVFLALVAVAVGNPYSMAWIAGHLVVSDGLEPADAVVPLRGSAAQERTRLDEAALVVGKRYAPALLVSVDSVPYYNQPVRGLVADYLKKKKFPAAKLRFCENSADNTREEAQALLACLQEFDAKDVIIVTSEFHTRRTRSVFRRVFAGSGIAVRVHPAYDPEYWDPHWWRRRRWAKTFFIEATALAWSTLEGLRDLPAPGESATPEAATAQTP